MAARLWCSCAAVILAAAMSSCDGILGPEGLEPTDASSALGPSNSAIEVDPSGPITLAPGDTLRLRVRLRTGGVGIFAFESTDSTVVVVGREGLVTGRKPGAALISIALRSDTLVRTSVPVTVRGRGDASITLVRLTRADSSAVDAQRLAGRIVAHLRFNRGDAVALEVQLDSVRACHVALSATAVGKAPEPGETTTCTVDTAAYDTVTAAPLFRNGTADLVTRLLGGDGAPLAATAPQPVRLSNPDTTIVIVSGQLRATDTFGQTWIGGDLTARGFPLSFGAGTAVSSVAFWYSTPDGRSVVAVDSTAPFRAVLTRNALDHVLDEALRINARAERANSAAPLYGVSQPVAYDAVPPAVGVLNQREWVGADLAFNTLYLPPSSTGPGVGRSAAQFFAGSSSLSYAAILASGARVEFGRELRESKRGAYRLALRVCDALLNCTSAQGFDFGVDLTPPGIQSINLRERQVNPTEDLLIQVVDESSGLPERPLLVAVAYHDPENGSVTCAPVHDGLPFPGTLTAGGCDPEPASGPIPTPRSHPGYYIYRIVTQDRAGNRGRIPDRVMLVDELAPRVGLFTVPAQFSPGADATLRASVTDDVDLASADFRFVYTGAGISLPFSGRIRIGRPFTGEMTQAFDATAGVPFVRTLTRLEPQRSTVLVSAVQARVVDTAGHATEREEALSPPRWGGNASVSDPFGTVGSATVSATASVVCTFGCRPTDATTLPVVVQIAGDAGMGAFTAMHLFARAADGTVISLGSTRNFAVVETGTRRTYTYTFQPDLPDTLQGTYSIFGVAVNSSGDALMSAGTPVEFVQR